MPVSGDALYESYLLPIFIGILESAFNFYKINTAVISCNMYDTELAVVS